MPEKFEEMLKDNSGSGGGGKKRKEEEDPGIFRKYVRRPLLFLCEQPAPTDVAQWLSCGAVSARAQWYIWPVLLFMSVLQPPSPPPPQIHPPTSLPLSPGALPQVDGWWRRQEEVGSVGTDLPL